MNEQGPSHKTSPSIARGDHASRKFVRRAVFAVVLLAVGAAAGFGAAMVRHTYAAGKLEKAFALKPSPLTTVRLSANWDDATLRMLMVGDSRVSQWRPTPAAPGLGVAIAGVGGETSNELLTRWRAQALVPGPDIIVLGIGANDMVAAGLNPNWAERILVNYADNLIRAVESATAKGIDVVVLTILRPAEPGFIRRVSAWSDAIPALTARANSDLTERLTGQPGVTVVDVNAVFPGSGPLAPEFAVDALHINEAAYSRLNAALLDQAPLR